MSWIAALIPAVAVALLVRLDAKVIGPYWALVELIRFEDPRPKVRRHTIWRRALYPAVVGMALVWLRPESTPFDAGTVAALGAGLLLWPMVFHGAPLGVVRNPLSLVGLYAALVASFFATGYLGGMVGGWFLADVVEAGKLGEFVRERIRDIFVAVVLWVVSATYQDVTAGKIEERMGAEEGD